MQGPEILIPLSFFIGLAIVIAMHIKARHRERTMLIEKGASSDEIRALFTRTWKENPLSSLKWGILFVMGGIALLVGNILYDRFFIQPPAIFGMIIFFVGIGLLLFYTIASKKMNE
jgi:hypothetical protein